jgi:hypothetical protein
MVHGLRTAMENSFLLQLQKPSPHIQKKLLERKNSLDIKRYVYSIIDGISLVLLVFMILYMVVRRTVS